MTWLEKLISVSGSAIGNSSAVVDFIEVDTLGHIGKQLKSLLRLRNGFYAFESALHVFPATASGNQTTLRHWNSSTLWRFEYEDIAKDVFFFAEDAFGNQFCVKEGKICTFDAETGDMNVFADNLEQWAQRVLSDYNVLTGYPLLHQWQENNGPLEIGMRLMPKIPFVLGGSFSLKNLYPLLAVSAMKSRGNLARQLKGLPDGAQVEFRVID